MDEIPSVVVADDGQLDRVFKMLEAMYVDPVRVSAAKARHGIVKPRDLIVMAWDGVTGVPALHDNAEGSEPVRVCFHSQDFLPLRDRLREQGVHYLVQSALDNDSLRTFFQSVLHAGEERRAALRLPLGGTVLLRHGEVKERVKLFDLSVATCRIASTATLAEGETVCVVLPKGLGGDSALEVPGQVTRSEAGPPRTTVVAFAGASDTTTTQLEKILAGEQIGTRATPLVPLPGARAKTMNPSEPDTLPAAPTDDGNARDGDRAHYERQVAMLDLEDSPSVLGRDLSTSGVCLTGTPSLPMGTSVTLALYGGAREEPLLVQATVTRVGDGELGLRFDRLDEAQRLRIERLIGSKPLVESLAGDAAGSRIVSRLRATG